MSEQSWAFVDDLSKPAYQWMVDQTARRIGVPSSGSPPFWAWHSCGGWQQPPDRDDFLSLFGTEPQPQLDLRMATLSVDDDAFSLSYYGPWCDLYQSYPFDPAPKAVERLWFDGNRQNANWSDEGNDGDLQAVLLRLERRQIVDVQSITEVFGVW